MADPEHEITNVEQILAAYEEPSKKVKKRRDTASLRKAPNAPKRFKSSYICFFVAKQPLIKAELGDQAAVTNISKRSAEMWKNLSAEERALWDDVAAKDKQRYMVEKAMYSGPWQVPWKRVKKDPSAPKRPMSAFLYYSQGKRADIKAQQNPEIKNTEVSRILGELWRNLSDEERAPFVERERTEREKYKVAIAAWRQENDAKVEAERKTLEMQAEMGVAGLEPSVPLYVPHDMVLAQHQATMMNPYAFPPYQPPPLQALYTFPTNGKQPIILGPNGTPYANQPAVAATGQQAQVLQQLPPVAAARPPAPLGATYDDVTGLLIPAHSNFDFSEQMGTDGGI